MNEIRSLTAAEAGRHLNALISLLQDAVDSGASVGFLSPLASPTALDYWKQIIADVASGSRRLLVAIHDGQILGSVQLALAHKLNGLHRAEIVRLIVHRSARRRGIGRALMQEAERVAQADGRTLIILDTRQGDVAESLYRDMGYKEVGVIPRYALSSEGKLTDTIIFFKEITPRS